MKGLTFRLMVLAATVLAGTAGAAENTTNPPPRLEIGLVDGSRVIGVPGIESVPVQTSYAKMDIPLKQIRSIKIESDHENVALALTNGDRLKGVLSLKPIEMETLFGMVRIDLTLVADISVYPGGKGSLPAALLDGLVLYYSFDKDEGGKVTDAGRKGNDGTVKGATWTPEGKVGGAYSLDGVGNYISRSSQTWGITNEWTFSAWVKPGHINLAINDERGIVSLRSEDDKNTIQLMHAQGGWERGAGTQFFSLRIRGSGGYVKLMQGTTQPQVGTWYHVAGTWDGTNARLYVNGVEDTPYWMFADASGSQTDTSRQLLMGSGCAKLFNGSIDEVRIYNRALSKDDVKMLYDAQK